MHRVSIRKKANQLNNVSCLCGLNKAFDEGLEAEFHANTHARNHDNAEIVIFNDGIQQPRDSRRAKPGRNPGGIEHRDGEGGGW